MASALFSGSSFRTTLDFPAGAKHMVRDQVLYPALLAELL